MNRHICSVLVVASFLSGLSWVGKKELDVWYR